MNDTLRTSKTDLVSRLRARRDVSDHSAEGGFRRVDPPALEVEAARHIESLELRVAELEADAKQYQEWVAPQLERLGRVTADEPPAVHQSVAVYDKCPFTGQPHFMDIEHPELGWVPTYGGPFDSYTIPTPDDDSERTLRSERYDHDRGAWIEGGEPLRMHVVTDDEFVELHELREERASTPPNLARYKVGDRIEWTNLLHNRFAGSVVRVDLEPRYVIQLDDGAKGHVQESELRASPTKSAVCDKPGHQNGCYCPTDDELAGEKSGGHTCDPYESWTTCDQCERDELGRLEFAPPADPAARTDEANFTFGVAHETSERQCQHNPCEPKCTLNADGWCLLCGWDHDKDQE